MYICFAVFSPILIQQLIVCSNVPAMPKDAAGAAIWSAAISSMTGGIPLFTSHLYALALALFGCKVVQTICGRTADQLIRRTALNVKTSLVAAVYRKSLRVGVQGIGRFEKGYILNLVNVDAEAVRFLSVFKASTAKYFDRSRKPLNSATLHGPFPSRSP